VKTLEDRFWAKVRKTDGCWLWIGTNNGSGHDPQRKWPFGQIRVSIDGKWKHKGAHIVSWILHNGPIPDELWVLHHCDNTLCVRPDHLFLGTAKKNTEDMVQKGRDNFWGGTNNLRNGRGRRKPVQWANCEYCLERFIVKNGSRFCSNPCRYQGKKTHALSPESLQSYREKRGFKGIPTKNCIQCGKEFKSRYATHCSRPCWTKTANATKTGKHLSPEALASYRRKRGWDSDEPAS